MSQSHKGENLKGNSLFMSLNLAALENIEFPNNIFEGVNISPKYAGQGGLPNIAQGYSATGHSTNKRGNQAGRHRTIKAHF